MLPPEIRNAWLFFLNVAPILEKAFRSVPARVQRESVKLRARSREGGGEAGRSRAVSRLEGETAAGALKSDGESCRKETLRLSVAGQTAQADEKFHRRPVDAD